MNSFCLQWWQRENYILFIVSPHIETSHALTHRGFAALFQRQPASHSHTNVLPHLVTSQYINNWGTAGDGATKPELEGLQLSDPSHV